MLSVMWSIAEVCERAGLSPRTVRYYEEIGLLPGIRRRAGGRRVYGADELERLRFISRLKALGLSLAEIAELNAVYAIGGSTAAMLERLRDLLRAHLEDVDRRIAELGDLRSELARYGQRIEERLASASKVEPPREAAAEPESASQAVARSRG
jgi:DNA-binding transcriptional MerR regulator